MRESCKCLLHILKFYSRFLSFFGLFCDSFKAHNTLLSIHIAILSLVEVGIKKRAIVYGRVVCDVPNWFCSSMKVILVFFGHIFFFVGFVYKHKFVSFQCVHVAFMWIIFYWRINYLKEVNEWSVVKGDF